MKEIKHGEVMLFCPADRPERFQKAINRADRVILDIEDAVAPEAKNHAREAVISALTRLGERAVVRINAVGTPWHDADIDALRQLRSDVSYSPLIMLPKADGCDQLSELSDFEIIALCETARGINNASALAAAPNCVALFWGGEDLIADIGGQRSRDTSGYYYPLIEQARSTVLLAASAQRKPAIDAVHIDINDHAGLRREARQAVDLGFRAKACIHPSHVNIIHEVFRPSEEECRWARDVIEALETAQGGVVSLQGRMIDEPMLRQAQRILGVSSS